MLPAFFLVFQSVFTDSASASERLVSLLIIAAAYGLLGGVFGFFARSCRAGLWLGAPAVVLIALYTVREPQQLLLHLSTVAVALVAGCGGAEAGARVRK